jgi:hypothetical protein
MHYDTVPQVVTDLINQIIEETYPDLKEGQVTVDAMFAFNDKGHPVKAGGYPALAMIKITPLKNRVKKMSDAEITIDAEAYDSMSEPQRKALLDHELCHLIVRRDKEGTIIRDDADRPKLKMRRHDYQMGWFKEIAVRHGVNSPEVYQASRLWERDGATFFPKATKNEQS